MDLSLTAPALWKLVDSLHGSTRKPARFGGLPCSGGRNTRANREYSKAELTRMYRARMQVYPPTRATRIDLIRALVLLKGVLALQRRFRRRDTPRKRAMVLMRRWVRKRIRNKDCPITLEPLQDPKFTHVSASGYVRGYNLDALVQYILVSGKGIDPVTRTPFTEVELKRMDWLVSKNKLEHKSVYAAIFDEGERKQYDDAKQAEETLDILEWNIHETFDDMLDAVEDVCNAEPPLPASLANRRLKRSFSRFKDSVYSLAWMNHERCQTAVQEVIRYVLELRMPRRLRSDILELLASMEEATFAIAGIQYPQQAEAADPESKNEVKAAPGAESAEAEADDEALVGTVELDVDPDADSDDSDYVDNEGDEEDEDEDDSADADDSDSGIDDSEDGDDGEGDAADGEEEEEEDDSKQDPDFREDPDVRRLRSRRYGA
jgi:hypothetical protein